MLMAHVLLRVATQPEQRHRPHPASRLENRGRRQGAWPDETCGIKNDAQDAVAFQKDAGGSASASMRLR